jgi:hypothetical protein
MPDEPRPCVYVDAAVNPDDTRVFYEISDDTADRLRQYAGDNWATLTFDQVCEAVCDELRRVLECYGALRDSAKAFGEIPPDWTADR